jgi:dipeptidyl-peptidase-4
MTVSTTPLRSAFGALVALFIALDARSTELTIERLFAAPDLSGPTLRSPEFSPDGKRIAYLKAKADDINTFDLWAHDVASGRDSLLVDSARLATSGMALSAEEEARRERQRTSSLGGILEYAFSPDSRQILVPVGGDLYLYDLTAPPERAVRRLTNTETYETDPQFSSTGRYVSFVRDANLVAIELASGREIAITRDGGGVIAYGVAEFIAQEEMDRHTGYWWSPDDSQIAFTRVDESPVAELERFEIFADSVKVVRQRYPAAGAKNAIVELFVAPVADGSVGAAREVDLGANTDIYLARVDWFPDSRSLAVQRQSRDQKTLTLLKADAASGATRAIHTERSSAWIDLNDELTFVSPRGDFLWGSDRSGYRHLELRDPDGALVRPVTQGDWMVTGDGRGAAVRGIDMARGLVYFTANAESPLERHLYVSSYRKTGAPKRITREAGWHNIRMADDTSVYVDTFSDAIRPPSVTLHTRDGAPRSVLVANTLDATHPYAPYLAARRAPEFGTLTARDGQTLYYSIITPPGMQPGQRYPVIVDVYGGPGAQRVRRAWGNLFHQLLAQSGYVVFALDNRGSGFRGVAFESPIYRRLGSIEVDDQVTGVEYLRSLPFVDPARIGIWGWSYGGYMTLHAMMQAPTHFAVGVSGAPVTDWALYDTHYTERYMGTPQDNAAGYKTSNVMTHSPGLAGPLLVIHGMADDNVLFTNSTALFKSLQTLNKPFDVMPYPGGKHGLIRHADMGPHALGSVKRYFDLHLKRD